MKRSSVLGGSVSVSLLLVLAAGCSGRLTPPVAEPPRAGTTVTAEELEGRTAVNVEELMIGKFAGVQIFRGPEGGLIVSIRGATSVMGSNEPLFVIDDMIVQPGPGGALVGLNPNDIQKIEVLKDIGATSRYGMQGANGVVVITTKRGDR